MKKLMAFAGCSAAIFAYQTAFGQGPATPTPSSAPNAGDAALAKAIELTGQLDQRLLTTVYFCLGTLITIFVVLIGYNWFATWRSQAREKELLRQELTTLIQSDLKALNDEFRDAVGKIKAEVLSSTRSQVQSEISGLKSTIADLQMESFTTQRDEWMRQGVPTNALRAQMGYLQLAHKHGGKYRFNSGLDTLETILREIREKKAVPPGADDFAELTRFLDEAASDNPIIVSSIKSQLERIRTS